MCINYDTRWHKRVCILVKYCNTLSLIHQGGMEVYASANFTVGEVAPLVPPTSPTPTPPDEEEDGLTDGQIAGIVVGSIAGFVVLSGILLLIIFCW